ncbi:hypothetical protein RIR_jg10739.t1 [Rhizophagus irregularis DAOM 181602=DAOM 197198]|nr:hypothetical protein RIR_jg10739.t1 [Rhizophagus irregularis DAOM 181602=DAOM 197198]
MENRDRTDLNVSHEDKSIISNFQILFKFVNDNNFEIKLYDDTVTTLKNKSDEDPYLRFHSESDIDLILGNK